MEYSALSKELTVKLSKSVKKQDGIYFTPPAFVKKNIELFVESNRTFLKSMSMVN